MYLNSLCPFVLLQQNAFVVFHSSHATDSLLQRRAERGETGGREEGEEEPSRGGERWRAKNVHVRSGMVALDADNDGNLLSIILLYFGKRDEI